MVAAFFVAIFCNFFNFWHFSAFLCFLKYSCNFSLLNAKKNSSVHSLCKISSFFLAISIILCICHQFFCNFLNGVQSTRYNLCKSKKTLVGTSNSHLNLWTCKRLSPCIREMQMFSRIPTSEGKNSEADSVPKNFLPLFSKVFFEILDPIGHFGNRQVAKITEIIFWAFLLHLDTLHNSQLVILKPPASQLQGHVEYAQSLSAKVAQEHEKGMRSKEEALDFRLRARRAVG